MNEIVKRDETFINALRPEEVSNQVALVQEIMKTVMKKDTHYGLIPGCGDRPTLLQPGAQKLAMTFRLAAQYEIKMTALENKHREYEVITTLIQINSGKSWGQGVGNCSTMETKFRYRGAEAISTGRPVPQEYWKNRDVSLIGGKEFTTKKIDGKYMICEKGDKKENPDIADTFNTVLKMAKKRSLVDAILTATAAGDLFTQDIEDFDPAMFGGTTTPPQTEKTVDAEYETIPPEQETKTAPEEKPKEPTKAANGKLTPASQKLYDLMKQHCKDEADMLELLRQLTEWIDSKGDFHQGRITFNGLSDKMADIARHKLEAMIAKNNKEGK